MSITLFIYTSSVKQQYLTTSSAMTETAQWVGDFKGVGHFEAKF